MMGCSHRNPYTYDNMYFSVKSVTTDVTNETRISPQERQQQGQLTVPRTTTGGHFTDVKWQPKPDLRWLHYRKLLNFQGPMEDKPKPTEEDFFVGFILSSVVLGRWKLLDENYITSISHRRKLRNFHRPIRADGS
jgi:hypothetical protein